MTATKIPTPSVEEAERVINHLLSYPDECEETLDAVRYIMQWLSFERPTEASLFTHARILRKPLPEGIREGVDHVPTTRHRTSIIVKGVLEGYLKWLTKNHPETGDDVDPDAGPIIHKSHHVLVQEHLGGVPERMYICGYCGKVEGALVDPCPTVEPHFSHHILVHDNLGATGQTEVCGYCGKTDDKELTEPCPEAERMNREEDAYRENPCANIYADVRSVKLAKACISMTEDYQSSPSHHPDHILVNLKDFNDLLEAMGKPPVNIQEGRTDG